LANENITRYIQHKMMLIDVTKRRGGVCLLAHHAS
jgi:hypothetical protein